MRLDERKRKVLQAIIDDYITTAEPIGSRTIARKYNLGVSPATIRNEMSDLEMLGFLEQPHTSAGRIPSAKGYRFYVDCLLEPHPLSPRDMKLIEDWYRTKVRCVEEVFQETVKILSRITRNMSLVMAPHYEKCVFKYLQFLPLEENRIIVAVISDRGIVENKIITMQRPISQADLQRIAAGINQRLRGLTFQEIKASLLREIRDDIINDPALYNVAMEVVERALTLGKNEKVYLGGAVQLINQPEFRNVEKLQRLLSILEEEQVLHDVLDIPVADRISVTIGRENKYTDIQDCSVIRATYRLDDRVIGTVAVLGPTRMDYGKIITVLDFISQYITMFLKKWL